VHALGDLLDHLGAERRDVVGLAAGHQALVGVDLLVHPGAAGVPDVGLHARPGRQRAAAHHVGLHQHPRGVADGRDRLAAVEERADEPDGVGIAAHEVRVGHPARDHQPVVVVGAGLRHGHVDRERVALVEVVEALDLPGLQRHQVHLRAGLFDRLAWFGVFDLLDAVGGEERDLLALQLASHAIHSSCG
jgi:hypothetical protein